MLGHETHASAPDPADEQRRDALADVCRGVRERLEGIARALGALRVEIDRSLDGHVPPASDGPPE